MAQELVSGRIRTAIREALVGRTLREIGDLFEGEGFSADLTFEPRVGGERRTYVEQFYVLIDWTQWSQVRRYLRVVEGVLDDYRHREVIDSEYAEGIVEQRNQLERLLSRDGFDVDPNGTVRAKWEVVTQDSVTDLPLESAIPDHLKRMWDHVEDRPEQAISAAKDAIESTAKHALGVLKVTLSGKEKVPALLDRVQKELKLHPATVAPTQKGAEYITKALGGLTTIAFSVDEIRNLYGDGHGRATRTIGLTSRHSRLVARCTDAYVGMILGTLDSSAAPWRADPSEPEP